MATAYEYSLSCGICLEFYDDPRILSCGHSFCFKCLQSLQNNRSFDVLIECPKCKAKSRSDRAYTKNFELRSLVQEFMEANKTQSDDRNMYCTDCDTLLSGEDISGHNRHNVVSLDEAITTFKVILEESTGNIDMMQSELNGALDKSKEKLKLVKSIFHEIELEVSRKKAEVLFKLEADIKEAETVMHNLMSAIPSPRELKTQSDMISFIEECQSMLQRSTKQDYNDALRPLVVIDQYKCSNKSIINEIRNFQVVPESVDPRIAIGNEAKSYPSASVTGPSTTLPRLQFAHSHAGSWVRVSSDGKKMGFASHASELIGDHYPGSNKETHPPYVVRGIPRMTAGRLYWEVEAMRTADGECIVRFGVTSSAATEACDPGMDASSWAVLLTCNTATTTTTMQHADQRLHEDVSDTTNGQISHRYGLLLDFDTRSLSVIDVDSSKIIYTFTEVDTSHGVMPAFGIYFDGYCTLRLVDPDEIHCAPLLPVPAAIV